ncbi:MAG TPA: polyprenyl synthetase family protein [Thermoanaerobaculia bacterium]|nr:polyprenyl synthetase family protein [Thermoanaerobaculia bacterium]
MTDIGVSTPVQSDAPNGAPANAPDAALAGDFAGQLAAFRDALERELAAWIEAKRGDLAGLASPQADALRELIDGVSQLASYGGKRLRPALVYHTYLGCGGRSPEQVLPLALAIELLHTYLLIHDDIMDHAEVRRGQPAAHARFRELHKVRGLQGDAADFGVSVAILLGDLAHGWAVELFAGVLAEAGPRSRQAELRRCFGAMCQEVLGGQYQELLAAARRGTSRQAGEEELLSVLRLKSGRYTAERPIQLGALLAGAPPAQLDALCRYGAAVGEAFQLQDDLLGVFGDAATVGKPVGADLEEGKFTFLIFHALEAADPAQREALESALGRTGLERDEVDRLCGLLEATGARAAVEAMVEERLGIARAALAELDELGVEPEGRLFFEGLLGELRERVR